MALIARYSFNESEGDLIKDGSGNNLSIYGEDSTGDLTYAKPMYKKDMDHNAFDFSGEELLKRENHNDLNPTNITVMAWVKYKELDEAYKGKALEKRLEILEKIGGYWLNIRTKNDPEPYSLVFGIRNSTSSTTGKAIKVVSSGVVPNDNIWHHVAGTFDGLCLRVFIDGVKDDSEKIKTATIKPYDHPLVIGAKMSDQPVDWDGVTKFPPEAFFYGMIDDVRIFDEALTQIKIIDEKDSYNKEPPAAPEPPATPGGFRIITS